MGQLIQESLCSPQVGGSESFGESAVDQRQLKARIAKPALAMPQAGEARDCPQFPGERFLPPRLSPISI
jgi:hypothetical protein